MPQLIGVQLRTNQETVKTSAKDPEVNFKKGEIVIVSLGGTKESGKVIYIINSSKRAEADNKILRKATREDLKKIAAIEKEEERIFNIGVKKIKKHGLSMKLIGVSLSFDDRNLTFYFTAEGRVDFRDLLKDLVSTFKKMIRLQQIGPKDATKFMGGFGPCGRRVCCQTFLSEMKSITMDLAREQNIEGVTSSKISGLCGKLMCCLDYESEMYHQARKNLPKIGEEIGVKNQKGKVVGLNILSQKAIIELEDGSRVEKKY